MATNLILDGNLVSAGTSESLVNPTFTGSAKIGANATTDLVGFFGATSVVQATSSNQAAVSTTAIASVVVSSVTSATNAATFGFVSSASATGLLTAVNSLVTSNAAVIVLLNQIRTDLVAYGLQKGS